MKKAILALIVSIFLMTPVSAQQTFNRVGRITSITTSNPDNGAFRVQLEPALIGCAHTFAFIDSNHGNYNAHVASALTAYSLGLSVTLLLIQVPKQDTEWCQIIDISHSR